MDRIIPGDEHGPSASENAVPVYLERQLAGDLAPIATVYDLGLETLDLEAHLASGMSFAELLPQEQDELLARVETGDVSAPWPIPPRVFFTRLVEAVAEGYYADPEHNGGNPEKRSWRMIGFDERTGFEGRAAI